MTLKLVELSIYKISQLEISSIFNKKKFTCIQLLYQKFNDNLIDNTIFLQIIMIIDFQEILIL
jgi:hypothetical protein